MEVEAEGKGDERWVRGQEGRSAGERKGGEGRGGEREERRKESVPVLPEHPAGQLRETGAEVEAGRRVERLERDAKRCCSPRDHVAGRLERSSTLLALKESEGRRDRREVGGREGERERERTREGEREGVCVCVCVREGRLSSGGK